MKSEGYFVHSYSIIASIKRAPSMLWQILVGWEANNKKCGSQKLFNADQVHDVEKEAKQWFEVRNWKP